MVRSKRVSSMSRSSASSTSMSTPLKVSTFFVLSVLAAFAWAGTARAESTINTVRLDISPRDDQELYPGGMITGNQPEVLDGMYFVYDYQVGTGNTTPGQSYTYQVDVRPAEGYVFSDTCAAEVKGAYEVALESRTADQIRLRLKTFPYYVLKNVTNIHEDGNEWKWNRVDYANAYDVLIFYEDSDGDDKIAKQSTTSRKVNVSSYYKGDKSLQKVEVRAKNTSDRADSFIAAGMYVDEDGIEDTEYSDESYSFRIPTARSNSIATSTSTGKVSSGSGAESPRPQPGDNASGSLDVSRDGKNPVTGGKFTEGSWQQEEGLWYFVRNNNQRVKGWINPDGDRWFYMSDEDGHLLTGWQLINKYWFYFNPQPGRDQGLLMVDWQFIDGKWYFLNATHGNGMQYGAMFANGTTPGGWRVGPDGAWMGY